VKDHTQTSEVVQPVAAKWFCFLFLFLGRARDITMELEDVIAFLKHLRSSSCMESVYT
jgi:hypothetical protein